MKQELIAKIKKLPDNPGVYLFKNDNGEVIYVGKAKSLKTRVFSYTQSDLGTKTEQMVELAADVDIVKVSTEIEALLLEAELVRKYKPKYNIQLKDDKTPIYIGITKDKFPRVVTIRRNQLKAFNLKKLYGPFLSALVARRILKRIRRVFPYSQHKLGKRPCIYSQLGLCNPCPNGITTVDERKQYLLNLNKLSKTLSGELPKVKKELEHEMADLSSKQDFEGAREIQHQIKEMDNFTNSFERSESYMANPNLLTDIRSKELSDLKNLISKFIKLKKLERIECFDVAHLAGTYPTASMVTFVKGEADKSLYRQFKILTKLKGDTDRLREVFQRRKKNFENWGVPDLIIVDGGRPQISIAVEVLGSDFAVCGLAKRYETLVFKVDQEFHEIRLPKTPAKNLLQRLRDEAHRFARRYHHNLVAKAIQKPLI